MASKALTRRPSASTSARPFATNCPRLWNRRTWDAVHSGDVDVADGRNPGGVLSVEVGGEVCFEGEHRGRRGEEDVARDVELPGHGYGHGGQRDVRHERRRAGEQRGEEQRRSAAEGLNGSAPGKSTSGARRRSSRRSAGKAAKSAAMWTDSAEDTVGKAVTSETSQLWSADSATARRVNGTRWPMPALGKRTMCGVAADPWESPEVESGGDSEDIVEHLGSVFVMCGAR
nr:unnamed protein product [Digitaria exilis]